MVRIVGVLAMLALSAFAAYAQQPQAPSATAQFAGQLATLLATTTDERDVARAQATACQQAAAHPPPVQTQEAPKQP